MYRTIRPTISLAGRLEASAHPVKIIVPGFNVVPCDKNDTILAIEKMRSLRTRTRGQSTILASNPSTPHSLKLAILTDLAVPCSSNHHLVDIRYDLFWHERWSDRTRSIESLGETPLRLSKLLSSRRDVVGGGVSEHIVHGFILGHVLGCLSDDNHKLGLVIRCVVLCKRTGDDSGTRVWVCQ